MVELADSIHTDHAARASVEPGAMDPDALFELRFSPSMALIATVRRFVTEFYAQVLADDDVSHRLAMATHELLENAARYGVDGRSALDILLRRSADSVKVVIQTKNRVYPDDLARATAALDGVIDASDPEAHYQALFRRAATRTDGGSGLGLGRIRVEADLALSYDVADDVLRILATGTFAGNESESALERSPK
jgi:hypothetical protein